MLKQILSASHLAINKVKLGEELDKQVTYHDIEKNERNVGTDLRPFGV